MKREIRHIKLGQNNEIIPDSFVCSYENPSINNEVDLFHDYLSGTMILSPLFQIGIKENEKICWGKNIYRVGKERTPMISAITKKEEEKFNELVGYDETLRYIFEEEGTYILNQNLNYVSGPFIFKEPVSQPEQIKEVFKKKRTNIFSKIFGRSEKTK